MKVSRRDDGGSCGGGEASGGSPLVAATASGAEAECTSVQVSNSVSREHPSAVGVLLSAMACRTSQIKKDTILLEKCQIECINLEVSSRHAHTYIHVVITRAQGYLAS